jgi:hypothetical protein
MSQLRGNHSGQGPIVLAIGYLVVIAIGAGAILVGMAGLPICEGNGLVDIGVGLAVLGVGGVGLTIRTPWALVAGAPGAVIIVVGAALAYLAHC